MSFRRTEFGNYIGPELDDEEDEDEDDVAPQVIGNAALACVTVACVAVLLFVRHLKLQWHTLAGYQTVFHTASKVGSE